MWRPISEYDHKNFDWVLVKFFDGDYECIPRVAEKRADGKWYGLETEKPINLQAHYFFDMHTIKEQKKMKIIDLYNMVANKEQPKKFYYNGREFAYSVDDKEFRSIKKEVLFGDYEYIYLSEITDLSNLNDVVVMYE